MTDTICNGNTKDDNKNEKDKLYPDSSVSENTTRSASIYKNAQLMKLRARVLALRPWSLSVSLIPAMLGSAIAYKIAGPSEFSWAILFFTLCTIISVHGAGNIVNTYFDFIKGIDNRKSDDRTLVDDLLRIDEIVSLGALLYIIGCVGFIFLANLSPARVEHLALVYFGGLSSSFLYTGGIGFKYIGLGDVLILIIFGPISVLFAFMAQTGRVDWLTIYYAIPLALNTEAILHSNNTRDLDADSKVGIVTLAILIGPTASHILYAILLFTPYIVLMVVATKYSFWFALPLLTLPKAFKIEKDFRCPETLRYVPRRTANLNCFFGLLYIIACCCTRTLPFFKA